MGKQVLLGHLPHVDAVHLHAAGKYVVKTAQQIDEGRFPGAAGAYQGHHLASRDADVNVLHDGSILLVAEAHIAELHFPLPGFRTLRVFRFRNVVRSVQHMVDALQPGIQGFRLVVDRP